MRDEFIELGQIAARNWYKYAGGSMPDSRELSELWGRYVVATGPSNPTKDEYELWLASFENTLKEVL